jgi:hypothetical protein
VYDEENADAEDEPAAFNNAVNCQNRRRRLMKNRVVFLLVTLSLIVAVVSLAFYCIFMYLQR